MTNQVLPGACGSTRRGERLTSFNGARHKRRYNAFTLIELIVVIGIIIVLSGLVLSTVGYARKKGARARAETEIAAMSAALENYKADNAVYPRNGDTDNLNVATAGDPSSYQAASQYLYGELSGDRNFNYVIDPSEQGNRSYFVFKSKPPTTDGTSNIGMLSITRAGNTYIVNYLLDPFGNSYGYSTRMAATGGGGYNPTFDLWSTSGLTANPGNPDTISPQWIKNW